ncbi:heavy metal-binding domain-containing protein [Jiangella alkaliphila]|nr:heavy metal-binding domain-containing protein [Jiangella alkaliphila]
MIPLYTTDYVVDVDAPITRSWVLFADRLDLNEALDELALLAEEQGANAVIGVKHSCWQATLGRHSVIHHYLLGTAVVFGMMPVPDGE